MLPNMKFYIASIVAIFMALGIGIYIGFSVDSQDFITVQQEKMIEIVESQFEEITKENQKLIESNDELKAVDKIKDSFVDESYAYIAATRLEGKKIAIIETSEDYTISSLGNDLENAGARVLNLTKFREVDKETVEKVTEAIVKGDQATIDEYRLKNLIESLGSYAEEIDYMIIGGGSLSENNSQVDYLDRRIVKVCKDNNKEVFGTEKTYVKNSYMNKYKEFDISTIDNIDSKIGKLGLVLAIDGNPGNYGVKGTAEKVIPAYKINK